MFYLIDKPLGISSFDVIRKLRKVLWVKKMGHSWTLDPLASWCLLIATENSTKLLPLLDSARKEYRFTVDISMTSDSLDLGTPTRSIVSNTPLHKRSQSELELFLCSQTSQIPPRYSALHIDGKRAYELAREEEVFTLKERAIEVYSASLIQSNWTIFEIIMEVSSWCYIRSFAPLIGHFYGNPWGWVITSLQRTKIQTSFWALRLDQSSDISSPSPLWLEYIFPTIPTYEIPTELYNDIKVWKIIQTASFWFLKEVHRKELFLYYKEANFLSLCNFDGGNLVVIRNQVG